MNGIKYLLDTNFILGLLKAAPETLALAERHAITAPQCAYSAITRMELLGFPGLQPAEEQLIEGRLRYLTYLPLSTQIEDETIRLRRRHTIKLPDAIIVASALVHGVVVLSHDQKLLTILERETQG
ncbi:MAG: type II toxin-antitoxin system VapC family toxin, partial [Comamonas sp.]|nr:type II toxin-antitoxin system VapC family toxin [Comamonas sp.]